MTERKISIIDSGSAEYWRQRTDGFRLIHEAEGAAERLADAPMYLHGGYDEDGDVIAIENLGPHDDMENAIRAIEENETAVSILVAQGRANIGNVEIRAARLLWLPIITVLRGWAAIRSGGRTPTETQAWSAGLTGRPS